jgi:tRNA G18 (ribose-2'-O)-methylase SpoU
VLTPEPVDDPHDPRVADYRDLRDPELRRRRGLFVAEGRFAVERLLAGGRFRVRSLLTTPAVARDLTRAVDTGNGAGPPAFHVAPPVVLRAIVGFPFHRGCVALAERGRDPAPAALIEAGGPRRLLLLDDVVDPANVGAVFRNALAFGVDAVVLSEGCADPLYRKAIRASAAATLAMPFARLADWAAGLADIRGAGYRVIALTPEADATDVAEVERAPGDLDRVALVVGAEGRGLAPASRAAADVLVRIAMADGIDSLNVATASGIALHRLSRAAAPRPSA